MSVARSSDPLAAWKVVLVVALTVLATQAWLDWRAAPATASAATAAIADPDAPLHYPAHIESEAMPRATERWVMAALADAERRYDGARPLVVVMGDSRLRSALADVKDESPTGFFEAMTLGGAEVDALILTEAAVRVFRRVHPLMSRILALSPARLVIQDTMFVPNSRYLRAGKQRLHTRGQGGPRGRAEAQWTGETLPAPGEDLEVAAYWLQQARRGGAETVVVELAPSALVHQLAPAGYFAAREALITPLLRGPRDRFLRLVDQLPDALYSDFRHFNDDGRREVRAWVQRACGGTL